MPDHAWKHFRQKCGDGSVGLVFVGLDMAKKSYRVHVVADFHEGRRTTTWKSTPIKYPRSDKKRRVKGPEAKFFKDWWPFHSGGSIVPRLRDYRHAIEADEAAAREKRPRDCHASTAAEDARPEKRGGKREGSGRPCGSFGLKKLHRRLQEYRAAEKEGRLHDAQVALRDLPSVMRQAAQDTDRQFESWKPAFLLRQRNKGYNRKAALRKLSKVRKHWEKVLFEIAACRQGWEEAIIYCRAVEKECLGAAAVHSTGLEVSAVDTAVFLAVLDVLVFQLK